MSDRTTENTVHITLPINPRHQQQQEIGMGLGRCFVSSADPENVPVVSRTANHAHSAYGVHTSSGALVDRDET